MPHTFNPANGCIVTANQNPFPRGLSLSRERRLRFAPYRSRQILDMLSRRRQSKLKPEDSLRVQKGCIQRHEQVPRRARSPRPMTGAAAGAGQNLRQPPQACSARKWDGQMDERQREPRSSPHWLTSICVPAVAERASPGKGREYTFTVQPRPWWSDLSGTPAGWFSDYNEVLLR